MIMETVDSGVVRTGISNLDPSTTYYGRQVRFPNWWPSRKVRAQTSVAPMPARRDESHERFMVRTRPGLADPLVLDQITVLKTAAADISAQSATTLRAALADLHPSNLAGFSQRVRSHYTHWVPAFDELSSTGAQDLIQKHADPVVAALALSMHRDGRIRELSVRALRKANDPLVVPFLLLRAGEWIGPVRSEAITALDPWIHADHAHVLLYSYPLLRGARFAPARPTHEIPSRIEEVLRSRAARQALLASINRDRMTTRTAVRIAAEQEPTIDLLERAVATGDVVATAMASRALSTVGEISQQAGELLWRHPTARLRQDGVFRLLKHGGDRAEQVAVEAMKDRSESVRSTAQRWYRSQGKDAGEFYRLLDDDDQLSALLGLGDDPAEADAGFAREKLAQRPAVRRAALRLLAKLGLRADETVFVNALISGSSRERRLATAWFRRVGVSTEMMDNLWALSSRHEEGPDRRSHLLFHLAPMTSIWTQVDLALRAINTGDDALTQTGVTVLRRVYHSSGFRSSPDPGQLARLRASFELAQASFGRALPDVLPKTDPTS